MRWLVAGVAFAAVLVLALYTAVLRGENVRRRLGLKNAAVDETVMSVALETEAKAAAERSEEEVLLRLWAEMRGIQAGRER